MSKKQRQAAAHVAGQWWADRLDPQHAEKRQAFAEAIERLVADALKREKFVRLESDYDPQGLLLDAVREIGIECRGFLGSSDGILPRKTYILVRPDRITPKEGYGNWTAEIPVTPL